MADSLARPFQLGLTRHVDAVGLPTGAGPRLHSQFLHRDHFFLLALFAPLDPAYELCALVSLLVQPRMQRETGAVRIKLIRRKAKRLKI